MSGLLAGLLLVAACSYLVASILYAAQFATQENDYGFWGSLLATGGWIAFTAGGLLHAAMLRAVPVTTFTESFLVLIWAALTLFLWVEHRLCPRLAGVAVLPPATGGMIWALTQPSHGGPLLPVLQSPWLAAHVFGVFLAYGSFLLAGVAAGLYLLQERELKSRRLTFMHFRLPSLATLERVTARLATAGFLLLGAGTAAGVYLARREWGALWPLADPKVASSCLLWALYGLLLLLRVVGRWAGRRMALGALAGVAAVALNYAGVNWLLPGLHPFR